MLVKWRCVQQTNHRALFQQVDATYPDDRRVKNFRVAI
uniref:Uncharacterized protein n=1 Tax=Vitis vinifera TaxID=29760 RepID=F6GTT7_VITVI